MIGADPYLCRSTAGPTEADPLLHARSAEQRDLLGAAVRCLFKEQISEESVRGTLAKVGLDVGEHSTEMMAGGRWVWVCYDSPTRFAVVDEYGETLPSTDPVYRVMPRLIRSYHQIYVESC